MPQLSETPKGLCISAGVTSENQLASIVPQGSKCWESLH